MAVGCLVYVCGWWLGGGWGGGDLFFFFVLVLMDNCHLCIVCVCFYRNGVSLMYHHAYVSPFFHEKIGPSMLSEHVLDTANMRTYQNKSAHAYTHTHFKKDI